MTESPGEPTRQLRAFDVASPAWRDALEDVVRHGAAAGTAGPLSERRARAVTTAVLDFIALHAENLEPLMADIRANTEHIQLEASRSEARRARLEHALGLADVVDGEVLP